MYSINIRSKTSISGAEIFTKARRHGGNVESVWMLTPGQIPKILQLCTDGAVQQNLRMEEVGERNLIAPTSIGLLSTYRSRRADRSIEAKVV